MKKFIKSFVVVGSVLGLAASALAFPVTELAPSPIATQPADHGVATVETWLAGVVTAYNTLEGTSLPAPGSEVFRLINNGVGNPSYPDYPAFGTGRLSITIPMGDFDYIVLHWGGNPSTDPTQAWYIGDEPAGTTHTFTAPRQQGLSGYSLFGQHNSVPDGGMTVMLLGVGLMALAPLRKKLNL